MPAQIYWGGTLQTNLEASVWSYVCITQNAEAIASLPAVIQELRAGQWVTIDPSRVDRRLKNLLSQPLGSPEAGAPQWSWSQLVETSLQHQMIAGNAFWVPVETGDRIAVRLLLSPSEMQASLDSRGYPETYNYLGAMLTPSQVVNIQNANPSSYWQGQSPLRTALHEIETDKTAMERIRYNIENRIGAGIVVTMDGYTGLNDEERDRILQDLYENYTSSSDDGVPLVIGGGAKVASTPPQGHSDLFDCRNFSKRAILAVFHTPPPMAGDYESATLNNMREAEKIWWKTSLDPWARQFYDAVTKQLVQPRFGEDLRVSFDASHQDIGINLMRDRAEVAGLLVNIGVPANDALAMIGLATPRYIPELDKPLMILQKAGREGADDAAAIDIEVDDG